MSNKNIEEKDKILMAKPSTHRIVKEHAKKTGHTLSGWVDKSLLFMVEYESNLKAN